MAATKSRKKLPLWHRAETRSVRPFWSAGAYLKDSAIRILREGEYTDETFISIEQVSPDKVGVSIRVGAVPKDLQSTAGVGANEARLVVSLEDRVFKHTAIAVNVPATDIGDTAFLEVPDEVATMMSWTGEVRIHVALLLESDHKSGSFGQPRRAGSWLAKKTFVVSNPRDISTFPIDAVDAEYFVKRGLPASTTYLVEVLDPDFNQSSEEIPNLLKVCVAKDVHAALAKNDESMTSRALMRAIYVDVISTVVSAGVASLGESGALQEDGILDRLFQRLARVSGAEIIDIRKWAKDPGSPKLRALVQAEAEQSRSWINSLQKAR